MVMKSKYLILLLMSIGSFAYAQKVDYDRIIPPSYLTDLAFPEKLVFLAWQNHPVNQALHHEHKIAEKNKQKANWAWLDIFTASYNLNEFTINPTEETRDRALFYPRYNFGARLDLGKFVSVPADIKIAKEEIGIANAALNHQRVSLRALVLRTYQTYLLAKETLELQTVSTEEAFSHFSLSEQRFKNGEITLEQYNTALSNYNAGRRNRLEAEAKYNIEKIDLEELIGIPLEDVK